MRPARSLSAATLALMLTSGRCAEASAESVDLALFMPQTKDLEADFLNDFWMANSAMALLAVDHFNARNADVVADLADYSSCPIVLNGTIYDTGYTDVNGVKQYTRMYSEPDVNFDAIVGAARSAVSGPIATLAGIDQIPQVSYWSTSAGLEDKGAYPYFLRTIPSDSAVSYGAAQLFDSFDYEEVGMLYVNDAYGTNYAEGFVANCAEFGIAVSEKGFSFNSQASIDVALQTMVNKRINVMMVVIFDDDFGYFMAKAYELGLLGAGKMMLFADAVSTSYIANVDTYALPYLSDDVTSIKSELVGFGRISPVACKSGTTGPLFDAWTAASDDLDSFNDRFPYADWQVTDELFTAEKYEQDVSCYVYDAVMAQGIAACQAYADSGDKGTGAERLAKLQTLTFDSLASGTVEFDADTGNRNKATGYYTLTNVVADSNGDLSVELKGTWDATTGWDAAGFVFSDGTSDPPAAITPPREELNQLGDDIKAVGYILFAVSVTFGLIFGMWTIANYRTRIVRASQPQFLLLIILGCLVSSATILPFAVDDSAIDDPDTPRDLDLSEDELREKYADMDRACQAVPFLYGIGFAITFTSLFAKIIRILRIFGAGGTKSSLRKTRVQVKDMAVYQVVGISVEAIICAIWSATDPLVWVREVKCVQWEEDANGEPTDVCALPMEDAYGNPLESSGYCYSDNAWPFMIAIGVIHFSVLVYSIVLCYKTRHVPTEFQEGKWINMAMVSNLQILVLGIPVLIMVAGSPETSFFLRCAIICLNDVGVLCVIFVPKIYAVHFGTEDNAGSTTATSSFTRAPSDASDRTSDSDAVGTTATVMPAPQP